ncbi:hypothetical protein DSM101010T_28710 [Desulfovibrio subterraneus]|uniref:Uncharacterized protein n=1 Tax=Desulfovibrio subterraneus TaxID=2718620 RepID=A0A7J0BLF8_9BACT|nr:hypothetical protein DSM101010T_28710 [Desulfovibrio subterraneus]
MDGTLSSTPFRGNEKREEYKKSARRGGRFAALLMAVIRHYTKLEAFKIII